MDTVPKQLDIKFDSNIDKKKIGSTMLNFFRSYTNFRLDRLRLKPRCMPRYLS